MRGFMVCLDADFIACAAFLLSATRLYTLSVCVKTFSLLFLLEGFICHVVIVRADVMQHDEAVTVWTHVVQREGAPTEPREHLLCDGGADVTDASFDAPAGARIAGLSNAIRPRTM